MMKERKKKLCPLLGVSNRTGTFTPCLGKECTFCADYSYGNETCSISGQSIYMPDENFHKAAIYIPEQDFEMWNERMMDENPDYAKMHLQDQHGSVAEWTASFNQDYHALIQIMSGVGGQRLFARVALYRNGVDHAVAVETPSHFLQDAYLFNYDGKTFDLQIEKTPF